MVKSCPVGLLLGTKEYRFTTDRSVTIGSGPEADILVEDSSIAPLHCEIMPTGQDLRLIGRQGSSFLRDRQVAEVTLKSGSRGRIGSIPFRAFTLAQDQSGGNSARPLDLRDLRSAMRIYKLAKGASLAERIAHLRRSTGPLITSFVLHLLLLVGLITLLPSPTPPPVERGHTAVAPPAPADAPDLEGEGEEEIPGQVQDDLARRFIPTPPDPARPGGLGLGAGPADLGVIYAGLGGNSILGPLFDQELYRGGGNLKDRGGNLLMLPAATSGASRRLRTITGRYPFRSMETVIVLDRTMSMHQGLELVRNTLLEVVNTVRRLVPHYRIGLVVFQDDLDAPGQGITTLPLDPEPWALLNRLDQLKARGGREPEEALLPPLTRAMGLFSRKRRAARTIILIGDASPPAAEREKLQALLTEYAGNGGILHTVYTPSPLSAPAREEAVRAQQRALAAIGRGRSIRLTNGSLVDVATLTSLVLGPETLQGLERLLLRTRRERPLGARVAGRKLASDRVDWLVRRLAERPINGDMVEEAIAKARPQQLRALIDMLGPNPAEALDATGRQAALYILLRRHPLKPILTEEELDRALLRPVTLKRLRRGLE